MPLTFFSHQAPVLPLKIKWPQLFCGQALVIGSMSPDFEFFLTGKMAWALGHTLMGQFTFCLPITLLMVWLVSRVIARPLALHLPDSGTFHLHDYQLLAETTRRRGYWLLAIPSALLGSFSHLWWDSFTHSAGWAAQHLGYARRALPVFGSHSLAICKVLQHGSTFVGGVLTLLMLYFIGKQRLLPRWAGKEALPGASLPSPHSGYALWLSPLVFALVGFVVFWQLASTPSTPHNLAFWSPLLVRTTLLAFVGLCCGCLISARLMQTQTPVSH